jgi:hypothetical protein
VGRSELRSLLGEAAGLAEAPAPALGSRAALSPVRAPARLRDALGGLQARRCMFGSHATALASLLTSACVHAKCAPARVLCLARMVFLATLFRALPLPHARIH